MLYYSPQPVPAATTGAASGVSVTKATLNGTVNPESLPTTYQFQYGTTTAYGHTTTVTSAGSGGSTVNASAVPTNLKPNTKYHFRIVSNSASGATAGADMTFKTKPRRPSIKLHPRKLHPGKKLHISGSAGGCTAHRVILISHAFGGARSFAGVPAVYAKVKKSSRAYAVSTTIPATIAAGRYAITARCGGGNLGVRALLRVL